MEERLEIAGKEYVFTVNRKAFLSMSQMQEELQNAQKGGEVSGEILDKMAYAYLKPYHKDITMTEVSKILDEAEKEYGIKQLMEFLMKLGEEVFMEAQEKDKYKAIPYLVKKGKKINK